MSNAGSLIDNSSHRYERLILSTDVEVCYRPECPEHIFNILEEDIEGCLAVLPKSVHHLVRRTKIWVNDVYQRRHGENFLKHLICHHDDEWLVQNRDNPEKVLGIEIYNSQDYCKMRLHWNGCGLLLHEICHLIHQQTIGLFHPSVYNAFSQATRSGKFERVPRRDWAGKEKEQDLAYCMIDPKEFFAEMSVTLLATGYQDLDWADATGSVRKCSPPIQHPDVLSRLCQSQPESIPLLPPQVVPATKHCNECFPRICFHSRKSIHCNKFYPFTRGQLYVHHPSTFMALQDIWDEIAKWEDPLKPKRHGFLPSWPWFGLDRSIEEPTQLETPSKMADTVWL